MFGIDVLIKNYKTYSMNRFISNINEDETLNYWRAKLFSLIMSLLVPLSLLLYFPSLLMCLKDNLIFLAIADTLAFLVMQTIFFYRKLNLKTSISLFLITLFILGLVLIYYMGWSGPGLVYLLGISCFSAIIHSKKAGFITLFANISVFIILFILSGYQLLDNNIVNKMTLDALVSISLNFIILNFLIVASSASLINILQNKLLAEKEIREKLVSLNERHILARKKAEQSDSFNKLLLEAIPLPFFFKNLNGEYLLCNSAFEDFFEMHHSEIIGRKIFDLVPKNLAEVFEMKDFEAIASDQVKIFETQVITKKGIKEIIVHKLALKSDNSDFSGIIGVIIDISDIKKAELEIRELNESLENKVNERTIELNKAVIKIESANQKLKLLNDSIRIEANNLALLNEKLAKSENELRIANQTKDKFLSIIAHDLRNPIGGMRNTAEAMMKYFQLMTKEDIEKLLNTLYTAANVTLELLDNLLHWARLQAGRIELKYELFSLNESIIKVSKIFKSIAESKKIILNVNLNNEYKFYFDKNSIETVLRNLLSNAVKFTPSGGLIEIGIHPDSKNRNIIVYVKDNGMGIKKENIEKIFKFDETITTLGSSGEIGTGLGLILCREFVEKHGGRIWVDSEYEKGSTFQFSIPIQ